LKLQLKDIQLVLVVEVVDKTQMVVILLLLVSQLVSVVDMECGNKVKAVEVVAQAVEEAVGVHQDKETQVQVV
jgi:hypothetical protein